LVGFLPDLYFGRLGKRPTFRFLLSVVHRRRLLGRLCFDFVPPGSCVNATGEQLNDADAGAFECDGVGDGDARVEGVDASRRLRD
jgi:hypothetical protein